MATVTQQFHPMAADLPASSAAAIQQVQGTNFPVPALAFDAASDEYCYFVFRAVNYGSGSITVDVEWYCDTQTSGDVVWGAQVAVITPNTDSQGVETDAFDTASTVTDSHIGTTAKRSHRASITVSNTDSLAADDIVVLRLYRDANAAGDTLTPDDALVRFVTVSYSDT